MDCTRKCGHFAFGDEAQFIRYLGYYVSIFTIPNYLRLDRRGLYYGIPGRKAGIFNGGEAGEAKASFFFAMSRFSTTATMCGSSRAFCAISFRA